MKIKKESIIFSVVIIVLLVLIGVILGNILNRGKKEVKVAKNFILDLYENGIIKESENEVVKEDILNKESNKNSRIKYSVIVGKYAVDIDKDYNVLGFSNKNLEEVRAKSNEIQEQDAIDLAESYLSKITKEEFKFKEIRTQEGVETSVYNVVFYKYKDGYPYYTQEINTLINKNTGRLEGYTNYPVNNVKYIDEINIKDSEAKSIVEDSFRSLNLEAILIEDPMLGYVSISDKEMVLAYIFNVKVDSYNKDKSENSNIVSLVRADTGEIINYNLETITK